MSGYQQSQSSQQSQSTEQTQISDQNQSQNQSQNELGNSALVAILQEQERNSNQVDEFYSDYYETHRELSANLDIQLSETQMWAVEKFIENWEQNRGRYESVASQTNMPPELIAAIHWRESSGNFNTYLHQGDPLGRPAVNWPYNIPVFHKWEDAAIHALNMKGEFQEDLGVTGETNDAALMGLYAEGYNGFGYRNRSKPINSPYVYAGTSAYSQGKYVADGYYSSTAVDQQVGVLPLLGAIDGAQGQTDLSPSKISAEDYWRRVVDGHSTLRQGMDGPEIAIMQEKLLQLGYSVGVDGDFGPGTLSAVRQFQKDHGLSADGVVGVGTASKLDEVMMQVQGSTSTSVDSQQTYTTT